MLKLFILRHGKAVKPENSKTDFSRKLNKKGTAQTNRIGYILQQEGIKPDQIIASGAVRTTETAQIVKNYLEVDSIYYDDELYLTSRENIQKIVEENAQGNVVLLVGHNFGLTDFVNYLTGESLLLSTAMLVEINFNFDDWKLLSAETGVLERIEEPQVYSF